MEIDTVIMIGDSAYPDNMGGSHRHIYNLSIELRNKGYEVIIINPNKDNKLPNYEVVNGVKYYRYPRNGKNKLKGFFDFFIGPYKIYRKLYKKNVSVIHGHWPLTNFLIFFKERKNKKIKKVYTFHGPVAEEYSYELKINKIVKYFLLNIMRYVENRVLKNSDIIITASNTMREKVSSLYGFKKNNICIVPVPTDTKKFARHFKTKEMAKKFLQLDENKIIIMSIRRLKKRMGLDNLIRAFQYINYKYPDSVLYIGGKGDYKDDLIKLSEKLGLKNVVKFLGFINEDKLAYYYEAADIFVMPSIDLEGFGLATTESMACGTIVVGTPIGGNKEIIGTFNKGFLAKSISYKDISDKIVELLNSNNKFQFNKEARYFVEENFSWEKLINRYVQIYKE